MFFRNLHSTRTASFEMALAVLFLVLLISTKFDENGKIWQIIRIKALTLFLVCDIIVYIINNEEIELARLKCLPYRRNWQISDRWIISHVIVSLR